jgi:hypothetical protein
MVLPTWPKPQARLSREAFIARSRNAYNGCYDPSLRTVQGTVDPNVYLNFARVLVDKNVAALYGRDIAFDVVEDEIEGKSKRFTMAQRYLDGVWKANNKLALLQKSGQNGCLCGDVFLQLVPPTNNATTRIVNLDPARVVVELDPMDCERALAYYLRVAQPRAGANWLSRRAWRLETWGWSDSFEYHDGQGWKRVAQANWTYPFDPIVHWQNLPVANAYYGAGELNDDVIHLIGRINLLMSSWNKSMLNHAHPKQWGKGFEADELRTSPDETTVLPNKDAELNLLEMKGTPAQFDNLLARLRDALHEIARLPEISTGKFDNVGVLSGLAISILYQPLLELTVQRRLMAGPALEETCRRILVLGGYVGLDVSAEWTEPLPADPQMEVAVLQADKDLGVASEETLSKKRGYDYQKETARKNRERTEQDNGPNNNAPGGHTNNTPSTSGSAEPSPGQ